MDFYDILININSFDDLKAKGWEITMGEKGEKKYDYFSNKENEENIELNRIGVLGVSGVGKSFILGKLMGKEIPKKIETKGLSIIYPEMDSNSLFVGIDSKGSEEPIIDLNNDIKTINNLSEKERKEKMIAYSKDKKFTEIFIQDFIIAKANIFIVVVDQLMFSEQKLINRLKKEF
jgi:hypothetical protein